MASQDVQAIGGRTFEQARVLLGRVFDLGDFDSVAIVHDIQLISRARRKIKLAVTPGDFRDVAVAQMKNG